jgi:hypothetical protein
MKRDKRDNTGCHHISREEVNKNRLLSFQNPEGLVGVPTQGLDFTFMLPTPAKERGMILFDVTYSQPPYYRVDPFIIFNRDGRILHSWPQGYIPSSIEVEKIALGLIK